MHDLDPPKRPRVWKLKNQALSEYFWYQDHYGDPVMWHGPFGDMEEKNFKHNSPDIVEV